MPKYVIERDLAGAGDLGPAELQEIATTSNCVLEELAPRAQWLHSYVTGDKIFCIYVADGPETIREHAQRGGFPVTAIHRIAGVIDPTTADPVEAPVG